MALGHIVLGVTLILALASRAVALEIRTCSSESNANKFTGPLPDGCPALASAPGCACSSGNYLVGKYALRYPLDENYEVNDRKSLSRPVLWGVTSRAQCCALCSNRNKNEAGTAFEKYRCSSWLHFPSPASSGRCGASSASPGADRCGYCIIFPPSNFPTCETLTCNEPSSPNFSTLISNFSSIGKPCLPADIIDDPHFVGARGTRYDFNGELGNNYCLVSDKGFHINALFDGYRTENTEGATIGEDGKATRSWMRDLGFVWTDADGKQNTLHLAARRGADVSSPGLVTSIEFNGVNVAVPSTPAAAVLSSSASLEFVGLVQRDDRVGEQWALSVNGKAKIILEALPALAAYRLPEDVQNHFNIIFKDLKVTSDVHGLIGQTYRNTPTQLLKAMRFSAMSKLLRKPVVADGPSGLGFLDGVPADYVASGIVAPDCKMSSF